MKKCEQAIKDAEFYHAEAESLRGRCNEILIEKQRYEQEVNSLRIFGKFSCLFTFTLFRSEIRGLFQRNASKFAIFYV